MIIINDDYDDDDDAIPHAYRHTDPWIEVLAVRRRCLQGCSVCFNLGSWPLLLLSASDSRA